MPGRHILKLMAGFKRFRESYFAEENSVYGRLASSGQTPKILVIGCSDSRVDPALLSSASPGDLFVVRNVANLVPPFEKNSTGLHGVSSAIEFAVAILKVETVIVLGHRQCGGIRALVVPDSGASTTFIHRWVQIAKAAKERVLQKYPGASEDELCKHCEKEAIISSIENLKTFPFVQSAIQERSMEVLGLYFDLEQGALWELDEKTTQFNALVI